MRKETHIKSYTAADLNGKRMVSHTDLKKVDAMTDAELEKAIAEDEDEQDLQPDWTRAELILSEPKQSVHLRLEREIIDFFKAGERTYLTDASGSKSLCDLPPATCQKISSLIN